MDGGVDAEDDGRGWNRVDYQNVEWRWTWMMETAESGWKVEEKEDTKEKEGE